MVVPSVSAGGRLVVVVQGLFVLELGVHQGDVVVGARVVVVVGRAVVVVGRAVVVVLRVVVEVVEGREVVEEG